MAWTEAAKKKMLATRKKNAEKREKRVDVPADEVARLLKNAEQYGARQAARKGATVPLDKIAALIVAVAKLL